MALSPESHRLALRIAKQARGLRGAERIQCLDEACRQDEVLRREVVRRINRYEEMAGKGAFDHLAPAPPAPQELGVEFGNYYALGDERGRGNMGVVYQARDVLGRKVAVKKIRAGGPNSQAALRRFLAEVRAVGALDHSGIIRIYDVGTHQGEPCFAMEFAEGGDLAQKLVRVAQPAAWAARVLEKLARAVQHAHDKGVVHRDLKPANVLLTADGEPKIADFGIAKFLEQEAGTTATGDTPGTPCYMAPEQTTGKAQAIGPATDVHALGAILYEMLTGRPPFLGATPLETQLQVRSQEPVPPRRLQPTVPRDLETICLKCLRKEPGKRYPSALALAEDLRRFLAEEPILARPAPAWERAWKWARRRPAVAALLGVSVAAVLGLLSLAGALWYKAELQAAAVRDLDEAKSQTKAEKRAAQNIRYAADIQSARAAWETNRIAHAVELLDRYRQPDEEDVREFTWYHLWKLAHSARHTLTGHTSQVWHVTFAPDGKTLVSAGQDRTVRLWDVATGRERHPPLEFKEPLTFLVFSPDSHRVAVTTLTRTVTFWDVTKREVLGTVPAPKPPATFTYMAFSPDGQRVAIGVATGTTSALVQLWDVETEEVLVTMPMPGGQGCWPRSLVFAPDGKILVTGHNDGKVRLWDLDKQEEVALLSGPHAGPVYAVAFAPDGKTLATAGEDRIVKLWDVTWDAGQARTTLRAFFTGHTDVVTFLAFAPDGKTLASGSKDTTVRLWDVAAGQERFSLKGHQGAVRSAAFSADGKTLATASDDKTVKLWDAVKDPEKTVLRVHTREVPSVAFSPDGGTVASGSTTWEKVPGKPDQLRGEVKLWDAATGAVRNTLLSGREVRCVVFSPDSKTLAAGGSRQEGTRIIGEVILWDVATGEKRPPLKHGSQIHAVAFTPDGTQLATAGEDKAVKLWDAATGTELQTIVPVARDKKAGGSPYPEGVRSLVFTPDGKTLVIGCKDGTIQLWDLDKVQEPLCLPGEHGAQIHSLALTADGRTLASASGVRDAKSKTWVSGEVKLWDLVEKKELATLGGYGSVVRAVAFSPDGRTLATGSEDQTVKLWHVAMRRELATFPIHQSSVVSLAFAPLDGRRLAAGCADGTVLLWEAATDKEVAALQEN